MTVAASGFPGYESASILGVFAPARTPAKAVDLLNQEIVCFINKTDVKERFFNGGLEIVGSSPKEFTATIKAEMTRMGKVIRDAGIKAE